MNYKLLFFGIGALAWFGRAVKHHADGKPALGDYCMVVACIMWGLQ